MDLVWAATEVCEGDHGNFPTHIVLKWMFLLSMNSQASNNFLYENILSYTFQSYVNASTVNAKLFYMGKDFGQHLLKHKARSGITATATVLGLIVCVFAQRRTEWWYL